MIRLSRRDRAVAYQVASLVLQYPDQQLLERRSFLGDAVATLPAPLQEPLARFLDHLASAPLTALEQDYVATFDMKRRCSLYLSYYSEGDTRKRGVALLGFKERYRAAGMELASDELPDFLPVVLEFAAADPAGLEILTEHRAALEVLRKALHGVGTPYADVVDAVCETLPALGPEPLQKAMRLVREGPPQEEVGLEPYAASAMLDPLGARR